MKLVRKRAGLSPAASFFLLMFPCLVLSRCENGVPSPTTADPVLPVAESPFRAARGASTGAASTDSLLRCDVLDKRRPRAKVEVNRNVVVVTAKAFGVGIPEELHLPAAEGSLGRFVFWPNGRHVPPRIQSKYFDTSAEKDFPASVEITFRHTGITEATNVHAQLDYEILYAGVDDFGRFRPGGSDELGRFVPGEFLILQCDRGVTYTVRP